MAVNSGLIAFPFGSIRRERRPCDPGLLLRADLSLGFFLEFQTSCLPIGNPRINRDSVDFYCPRSSDGQNTLHAIHFDRGLAWFVISFSSRLGRGNEEHKENFNSFIPGEGSPICLEFRPSKQQPGR